MIETASKLLQQTIQIRKNAYAPYSQFLVAACLSLKNGETIFGVNLDNSSFGASFCAERNAISSLVTKEGHTKNALFLLLVTDTDPVAHPCGICLQVMSEFFPQDFPIYLANLKGIQKTTTLGEIFPCSFKL